MPSPLSFETAKIALGIPVGSDSVPWRFLSSLMEMEKTPQHGLIIRQGSLVDRNRNEIVKLMLDHPAKFTHLCMIDSDMVFPNNALRKLFERKLPVVGGLCYQRTPPFPPVVYQKEIRADRTRPAYTLTTIKPDSTGLQKVDSSGTGFLLIEREVFEKISPPWFAIEWIEGHQRGEDLFFAERCAENQIACHLDTTVSIGHLTTVHVEKAPQSFEAQIRFR